MRIHDLGIRAKLLAGASRAKAAPKPQPLAARAGKISGGITLDLGSYNDDDQLEKF